MSEILDLSMAIISKPNNLRKLRTRDGFWDDTKPSAFMHITFNVGAMSIKE